MPLPPESSLAFRARHLGQCLRRQQERLRQVNPGLEAVYAACGWDVFQRFRVCGNHREPIGLLRRLVKRAARWMTFLAGGGLRGHLQRQKARPELTSGTFEERYRHARRPLVSIIIPTRDGLPLLRRCLDGLRRTSYPHIEILVVDNGSRDPAMQAYLEKQSGVRVLRQDEPFHWSRLNNAAVAQAQGEVLLLLNDDVEPLHADWLERMLEHALRPEVGAVGAKLLYPDGTIQHAGIVLGLMDSVGHVYRGQREDAVWPLLTVRNYSAVTGACLMVAREKFEAVGGLDDGYPVALGDVDFCLKLGARGWRTVWTPHARLTHHEGATRGRQASWEEQACFRAEIDLFETTWYAHLRGGDPCYSPHLRRQREDGGLDR